MLNSYRSWQDLLTTVNSYRSWPDVLTGSVADIHEQEVYKDEHERSSSSAFAVFNLSHDKTSKGDDPLAETPGNQEVLSGNVCINLDLKVMASAERGAGRDMRRSLAVEGIPENTPPCLF